MRSKNDSAQTMPEGYDLSQRIIDNYRLSTQPVRTDYLDYLAQKSITWADELEQKRESQKKSTESLLSSKRMSSN
jgi:phage portal protein BeeE